MYISIAALEVNNKNFNLKENWTYKNILKYADIPS